MEYEGFAGAGLMLGILMAFALSMSSVDEPGTVSTSLTYDRFSGWLRLGFVLRRGKTSGGWKREISAARFILPGAGSIPVRYLIFPFPN